MRAVAVFLVIFYHFGFFHVPGGDGVIIFFVLSGFLITWLLLQEEDKNGAISLSGFYRRRLLRIFPAFDTYWLVIIIVLYGTHKHVPWGNAFSALFYVSDYYNASQGDPNSAFSHTWSLAIEEQFYLLWPLVFSRFHHNLRAMTKFLAGLILTVWIYRIILCVLKVDQGWIYAAFDTRMDHLAVGCLLAVLLKRSAWQPFWNSVCAHPLLPLITIGLLLISIYDGGLLLRRYRDVVGFAVEPVLIAVLLVQLIAFSAVGMWRWLEWPLFRFLGRISYSLYLYQQLTLFSIRKRLEGQPVFVQLILAVLGTTVVASLSYFVIEQPFLKLKRQRDPAARLDPVNA